MRRRSLLLGLFALVPVIPVTAAAEPVRRPPRSGFLPEVGDQVLLHNRRTARRSTASARTTRRSGRQEVAVENDETHRRPR